MMNRLLPQEGSFYKDTQALRDPTRAAASKSSHQLDLFDHYKELCLIQNQTVGAPFHYVITNLDTETGDRYIISLLSAIFSKISKLLRIRRASQQQASGTAPGKFCHPGAGSINCGLISS
jgi:hypothetical protein